MELFIRPIIGIIKRLVLKYDIHKAEEVVVTKDYLQSCIMIRPNRLLIYDNWYSATLDAA